MNRKDWTEALLFSGFRMMAVFLVIIGTLGLLFQLLESWSAFDPSYFRQFISSTVLRPLIVILTGLLLLIFSGRLSRLLARGGRGCS